MYSMHVVPVIVCHVSCTGTEAAVFIYSVQGHLCMNENNGYNAKRIIGNKQKINNWWSTNIHIDKGISPNKDEEEEEENTTKPNEWWLKRTTRTRRIDDYSESSSKKIGKFRASVEVHIQNSEWNNPKKEGQKEEGGV